jgi:hypothetical protein
LPAPEGDDGADEEYSAEPIRRRRPEALEGEAAGDGPDDPGEAARGLLEPERGAPLVVAHPSGNRRCQGRGDEALPHREQHQGRRQPRPSVDR